MPRLRNDRNNNNSKSLILLLSANPDAPSYVFTQLYNLFLHIENITETLCSSHFESYH